MLGAIRFRCEVGWLFLFVGLTLLSAATTTLFDDLNAVTQANDSVAFDGPLYASFSAGTSPVTLTDVMAKLTTGAMGMPGGSITVGLYSDAGTMPGTLLLKIGTLADSALPSNPAYQNFDFPVSPPFALNPSVRYWIGFSSTNQSHAALAWTEDTTGPGVAGEFNVFQRKLYSNSSGPYQLRITASSGGTQSPGAWVQQHPQTSPSARATPALGFDSAHGQTLLFGGASAVVCSGCLLTDTWVWDGANWAPKSPKSNPPSGGGVVFDTALNQLLIFDGALNPWAWDGANWTQQLPQNKPPARGAYAMAYDAAHGQVVMFGGRDAAVNDLGDTWVWDGSNWTQKRPQTSPEPRSGPGMVYDAAHDQIVLFGGLLTASSIWTNETWIWDGSNWTQKLPKNAPPGRWLHAMAYDPGRGQVVLFGGAPSVPGFANDTWTWDGSNWTEQFPQNSPSARVTRMSYDSVHEQMVLFGGYGPPPANTVYGDTWTWSSGPLPPASIKAVSGDGQSGAVGAPLANPVVVLVSDSLGNVVAGATVTFSGTNATVNPAAALTDSTGRASSKVTLGTAAGSAQVAATVASLAPVNFNFTAVASAPAVTIKKTWQSAAGGNPLRGDMFTYSIQVTNTGSAAATAVNVQDIPDPRAELALQGPLTFNLGTLAPSASQTLTVNASASAAGSYTNVATVSWSDASGKISMASASTNTQVDPQPGDFTASTTAPVPLKTGVGQVLADGANVYVVNNPGDSLTVLNCASGACNVTSTVALGAGAAPVAVAKMDVDGDGQNDVLVLNQGAGTITTLLSSNPGVPQVSSVGAGPVAFAPFNVGDGTPRVAVVFPGMIAIFVWDGQQFQPAATVALAGSSPSAVVNGDFNGDRVDDLLVADSAAGTLQLFLGDGMGGLNPASQWTVGPNPVSLAAGDIDNSGSLDVAVSTAGGLVVLLNDGAGNLTAQPAVPTAGAGSVVLADFNGDGNLDAAVANANGASVSLYRGDGSGALLPAGTNLTGSSPVSLAATDLDNDGTADLIAGDSGSQDLTILLFPK